MIGSVIKRLRTAKNVTQEGLARRLGVSRQAICMWEANRRELKATMLNKMARFFDVSVDLLVQPEKPKINQKGGTMAEKGKKGRAKKSTFELMAPAAKKVALSGSFNSWDAKGIAMKKSKTGLWKAGVSLNPGRYEYKFIVDGQWWTDPTNSNTSTNSYGTTNSVREVTG